MKATLGNGKTVLYSPEDHDLISKCTLTYCLTYCVLTLENKRRVHMHRFLMGEPKGKIVDHINKNRLDNRRENLRITDRVGNSQNKTKKTGTSSKYIGVHFLENNKWLANISVNGKTKYIGRYKTEIEAAKARDAYIVQKYPESIYTLNFPKDRELSRHYKIKPVKTRKANKPKSKQIKTLYVIRLIMDNKPDAFVTIDREDYDKIKYDKYRITGKYVKTAGKRIHRFLMNETDPNFVIDHIDKNPYNNTRSNLSRVTPKDNCQNKSKSKRPATSIYVGVYLTNNRWKSRVMHNGKLIRIGSFSTEYEAAIRRDFYIINNLPGTYYAMNCIEFFPLKKE
jgi:hypothetical protein